MTIIQSIDGEATIQVAPDKYAGGNVKVYDIITQRGKRTHTVKVTLEALTELFRENEIAVVPRTKFEEIKAQMKDLEQSALEFVGRGQILEAIESLASAWETDETMADAANAINAILHPEPPYEFPHGTGAVIEAANRDGNSYPTQFVWVGGQWHHHGGRKAYTEDVLKSKYHQFKTLTEGVRT